MRTFYDSIFSGPIPCKILARIACDNICKVGVMITQTEGAYTKGEKMVIEARHFIKTEKNKGFFIKCCNAPLPNNLPTMAENDFLTTTGNKL